MTDNEIIKALECCQTEYDRNCKECPYERYKTHYISTITCSSRMRADLLDLINRQKAEIERLQKHIQEGIDLAKQIPEMVALAQAEAIKEIGERLKAEACLSEYPWDDERIYLSQIDNLVKEMVGDNNGE